MRTLILFLLLFLIRPSHNHETSISCAKDWEIYEMEKRIEILNKTAWMLAKQIKREQ